MTNRHPHHGLIVTWAADTSRVVQRKSINGDWTDVAAPSWSDDTEYRFKPEPKPDVVESVIMDLHGYRYPTQGEKPNLRLTFDGETGKLKAAEVLE